MRLKHRVSTRGPCSADAPHASSCKMPTFLSCDFRLSCPLPHVPTRHACRRSTPCASHLEALAWTFPPKGWSRSFAPAFRPQGEACARARSWVVRNHFSRGRSLSTGLMAAAMVARAVPVLDLPLRRLGCLRLPLPGAAGRASFTVPACRFLGKRGFAPEGPST